jgi:cytoskeletal protein CcmA (bactofilin family)
MPQQPTKGDKQTLIEQGTEFKGTMKSTCPVVVNGRMEGDLSAPELDVTSTGVVRGNIKADRLSSRGNLSGNIDAGDLFLSGAVGSKTVIKAKNLEVKLSPEQGRMELTIGECTLDIGDEPTRERRVEPSPERRASSSQLPVSQSLPPGATASGDALSDEAAIGARSSAPGGALSKPPASKKTGARDSVPPGA